MIDHTQILTNLLVHFVNCFDSFYFRLIHIIINPPNNFPISKTLPMH